MINPSTCKFIITAWNIQGYWNTSHEDALKIICSSDITAFSETFDRDIPTNFQNDYFTKYIKATKDPFKISCRCKGGIMLSIKKTLESLIEVRQETDDWILIQINKSPLTFKSNLSILFPYISSKAPPSTWKKFESLIRFEMEPP